MTLLFDFAAVPDRQCDDCLDGLHKALASDPGPKDSLLWEAVDNPWLRQHVEDATRMFQAILRRLQDAMARALTGKPIGELKKAAGNEAPWQRWDELRFQRVAADLESRNPDTYSLDDWMLLVDYLVQRYAPPDALRTQAEYLVVRAALLGKIAANMERKPNVGPRALVPLVPTRFDNFPPRILTHTERMVLEVAHARVAENISALTDRARHDMKGIIIEHLQAKVLGQKQGTYKYMTTRLFDEFGQLNRDFRRIAVTEGGEVTNQGFVAGCKPGAMVRRHEAYRGACDFCRSINNRQFTVVEPDAPDKDGETQVWLGKTNIGRSASPRKKVGDMLIERTPDEMWWPAAGTQHPNCRGSWSVTNDPDPAVNPAFTSWLDGLIATAQGRNPKL